MFVGYEGRAWAAVVQVCGVYLIFQFNKDISSVTVASVSLGLARFKFVKHFDFARLG